MSSHDNQDKQRVINRDANATLRAAEAVRLRARKLTFQEIANRCSYASPGAARNAIQRELKRIVITSVEQLRREESAMLDALQSAIFAAAIGDEDAQGEDEKARGKKPKPNLFAVDRVLAISKRRSELLGIDATREEAGAMPIERRYVGVNVDGV